MWFDLEDGEGTDEIHLRSNHWEERMRFANVSTLKTQTAELLQAVEAGEDVVITYYGKPKAALVKLREEEPPRKDSKRKQGVLRKDHPFLKLMNGN
jgi:prevent-host-death family protein